MRIVFSGMIAADPHQGGATWAVLQYLLGFRALGHEVYFVEPVPEEKIRPENAPLRASINASYFRNVAEAFNLERCSSLVDGETGETVGLTYSELSSVAARSDLLVNVSGMLRISELVEAIPVRLYLDLDPGFAQVWHAQGIDMGFDLHTHFATVGLAIGGDGCMIPDCGRRWITTLQPVHLPEWEVSTELKTEALTTVGNWRGYGSVEHDGIFMGQKAHSMRRIFGLPAKLRRPLRLAMAIHEDERKDTEALCANRWEIVNPADVANTPDSYRDFVRGSYGELGVSKSGYVDSRSGWFSDRSACYLASGRPVIGQDTGFSRYLPTGEGLFAFETEDDVAAAARALDRDYSRHSTAARRIAETHFDSRKVLSRLLEEAGEA